METSKKGYRKDLKQFFRSKMEANVARYYGFFDTMYFYESNEFEFLGIKRGTRFYKPDFYLPLTDVFIEVKGWFRKVDKTKIRRFKKYFPECFKKLRFIIPDKYARSKANGEMIAFLVDELGIKFQDIESYEHMERFGSMIPGWE